MNRRPLRRWLGWLVVGLAFGFVGLRLLEASPWALLRTRLAPLAAGRGRRRAPLWSRGLPAVGGLATDPGRRASAGAGGRLSRGLRPQPDRQISARQLLPFRRPPSAGPALGHSQGALASPRCSRRSCWWRSPPARRTARAQLARRLDERCRRPRPRRSRWPVAAPRLLRGASAAAAGSLDPRPCCGAARSALRRLLRGRRRPALAARGRARRRRGGALGPLTGVSALALAWVAGFVVPGELGRPRRPRGGPDPGARRALGGEAGAAVALALRLVTTARRWHVLRARAAAALPRRPARGPSKD